MADSEALNRMLAPLERALEGIGSRQATRRRRTLQSPSAPRVTVDGRAMLAFCSNDYLGLAAHPLVVAAFAQGLALYGAGSGASHLVSGHTQAHAGLEERLAAHVGPNLVEARALYFCSGYMANLAVLTTLSALPAAGSASASATLFCDALNHASLIDGARLARTQAKAVVRIYPHHDLGALETLLVTSEAANKIIVTDGVFSMDGDIARVPELVALAERHDAWLVVDDAHGYGVLGDHGRGVLEHFAQRSGHVVLMGTLGKAAGVGGAFVAAHAEVVEWLIQHARTYIYTTAPAPAQAHALLASVDLIDSEEGRQRRAHLHALITRYRGALRATHWRPLESSTAIQPLLIGTNQAAIDVAAALDAVGLWIPAIRPPTVAEGTARLRVTLSAAHTCAEVDQLTAALNAIEAAHHGSIPHNVPVEQSGA